MESGVVSSFNPDEIPEDYQHIASMLLRNDIIKTINCSRTMDVTELGHSRSILGQYSRKCIPRAVAVSVTTA